MPYWATTTIQTMSDSTNLSIWEENDTTFSKKAMWPFSRWTAIIWIQPSSAGLNKTCRTQNPSGRFATSTIPYITMDVLMDPISICEPNSFHSLNDTE